MSAALPEYFRLIDLSLVPVPDFVEALDYEAIRQSSIDYLVSLDPGYTALLESDPVIKLIEAFSYRELLLRQRINDAARGNTITSAVGNDLKVIGALFGVTPMDGEKDDAFRRRVQLGIYKASVAGPRQAYEFHALSAHPNIVDVSVHSPAPGEVAVTVLAFEDIPIEGADPERVAIGKALFAQPIGGSVARVLCGSSSDVLKAVRLATTGEDVRPLTDTVVVQPPTVKPFTIVARLVIYPGPDAATVKAAAIKSLSAYLQRIRRVSYDATRSGIISALNVGGVQNVVLTSPAVDIDASFYDLPVCLGADVEVERVDV